MNSKYILTISVATYNSMDHIEPLLNSLKDLWNHEKIRISFIDDGSKDSTVAFLKSKTSAIIM